MAAEPRRSLRRRRGSAARVASPSGGSSSPHSEELAAAATERDNLATSVKVQARVLALSRPRLTPHHQQQESETLSHLGFGSPSRNVRHDRSTAYLYGVRGSNHPFICSDRLIDTHIAHSSSLSLQSCRRLRVSPR